MIFNYLLNYHKKANFIDIVISQLIKNNAWDPIFKSQFNITKRVQKHQTFTRGNFCELRNLVGAFSKRKEKKITI